MIITNENAKTKYDYERVFYGNNTKEDILRFINKKRLGKEERRKYRGNNVTRYLRAKTVGKSNKYGKSYIDISIAFDIETTTLQKEKKAVMYTWQMGINNNVIHGREWWQFIQTLNIIRDIIEPTQNQRVICWVANLGFEFQFMRKLLNVTDSFLKEQRKPCYIEHDNWLIFQDALLMTSSSLVKLASDYTNTQKCIGDLDYDIIRNKETPIDDTEYRYNDNDVLILTEWADYFYNTYICNGVKPLTATGVLSAEIDQAFTEFLTTQDAKWYKDYLQRCKPSNELEYKIIMDWLYRGGYVHANELYVGRLFTENDNIASFDFTSSYPSVITYGYCPSEFKPSSCSTQADAERLNAKYCTWGKYTFYNIVATTNQTIESKSKCIACENAEIDNGRIRSATKITVYLTELDYASYNEFYEWTKCEVSDFHCAKRVKFPRYLVEPMLKYYVLKDILKKQGKNYAVEKGRVNTFYGYCVKKLNTECNKYDNGGWSVESAKSYEEQMSRKPCSPFLGVWVSARARRNLLATVYQVEKLGGKYAVLYCDTDSIKILHHDETTQAIIDKYNVYMEKCRNQAVEEYNLNAENISDLGYFDQEYTLNGKTSITRFKTLGAKRYIVSYLTKDKETGQVVEKHNQTICGLPKNILAKKYDRDTMYNKFENELTVTDCKLTSSYIDDPFDIEVNGVMHHEESALALIKSDYTMSLDDTWVIAYMQLQNNNREVRNNG